MSESRYSRSSIKVSPWPATHMMTCCSPLLLLVCCGGRKREGERKRETTSIFRIWPQQRSTQRERERERERESVRGGVGIHSVHPPALFFNVQQRDRLRYLPPFLSAAGRAGIFYLLHHSKLLLSTLSLFSTSPPSPLLSAL